MITYLILEFMGSLIISYFVMKVFLIPFLKKYELSKKYLNAIYISVISFFSVITFVIIFCLFHCVTYPKKFDSETWKQHIELRKRMSNDLIVSKQLLGKTKQDIIEILGKNYETNSVNKNTIFYIIDWNSYGGDPEVLYIKFKDQKVSSVGRTSS